MMEGGGELTEEELAEIEETQLAPLRFQALVWRLQHAGRVDDVPSITIIKTPGVRVTVSAPMLAEIVARQTELTGVGEVAQTNELRHVIEVPLIECWQMDRIDQVPELGDDFEIPDGASPLSLVGQRDGAQRLTDEMTADLIDAGLRLAGGPAGDILDIAELAYGLYAGRDFYGRKVTNEHLFLMGLSVLPIIDGSMVRAGSSSHPCWRRRCGSRPAARRSRRPGSPRRTSTSTGTWWTPPVPTRQPSSSDGSGPIVARRRTARPSPTRGPGRQARGGPVHGGRQHRRRRRARSRRPCCARSPVRRSPPLTRRGSRSSSLG
jgi:hypothetical protein